MVLWINWDNHNLQMPKIFMVWCYLNREMVISYLYLYRLHYRSNRNMILTSTGAGVGKPVKSKAWRTFSNFQDFYHHFVLPRCSPVTLVIKPVVNSPFTSCLAEGPEQRTAHIVYIYTKSIMRVKTSRSREISLHNSLHTNTLDSMRTKRFLVLCISRHLTPTSKTVPNQFYLGTSILISSNTDIYPSTFTAYIFFVYHSFAVPLFTIFNCVL